MNPTIPAGNRPIDWAVAQRALPGETVSGDLYLVQPYEKGVLLALVDGIGHGPEATRVAETAVAALRLQPDDSIHALIKRCNSALSRTRGVVLTIASFNQLDGTVTWGGIGNVEALLFRRDANGKPDEKALVQGGTVGTRLPPLYVGIISVCPGDVLIMSTDGIRREFEKDVPVKAPPKRIANHIIEKYCKETDDACVLVARFIDVHNHE